MSSRHLPTYGTTGSSSIADYIPGSVVVSSGTNKLSSASAGGVGGSGGGNNIGGSGLSSYSGISTLDKQYAICVDVSKPNIVLFVRANSDCIVPGGVEQLLRMQQQQNQNNQHNQTNPVTKSTEIPLSGYTHWDGGCTNSIQQQQQQSMYYKSGTETTTSISTSSSSNSNITTTDYDNDTNDYEIGVSKTTKAKNKVGRLFQIASNVAGKTVTSIERSMQTLAVKADAGRNPDQMMIGLYYTSPISNEEILVSASEAQPIILSTSNDFTGSTVPTFIQFVIPLQIPTHVLTSLSSNPISATGANSPIPQPPVSVRIKLWIRSGATTTGASSFFLSKYHWLGSTPLLNINDLLHKVISSTSTQTTASAFKTSFLKIPIENNSNNNNTPSSYIPNGMLYISAIEDCKYPLTPNRRGWSICDPIPNRINNVSNWYNLPLHQFYGFPYTTSGSNNTATNTNGTIIVATERTIESTIIMPIVCAITKLVHVASIQSLVHSKSIYQNILLNSRHDIPSIGNSSPYIDTNFSICYIQPITGSTTSTTTSNNGLAEQQIATISAFWQRPNSIFEVDLTPSEQPDGTSAPQPIRVPVVQQQQPVPPVLAEQHSSSSSSIRFYPKPVRTNILPAIYESYGSTVPVGTGFFLGTIRIQLVVSTTSTSSLTSSSSLYYPTSSSAAAVAAATSTAALFRSARNQFTTATTTIVPQNPFDTMCGIDTTASCVATNNTTTNTTTTTTTGTVTPSNPFDQHPSIQPSQVQPSQVQPVVQPSQQQLQPQQNQASYDSYYGSTAAATTKVWECIIPLEALYQQCQQSNSNTKGFTVYDISTNQPIATLFANVTMEMKQNNVVSTITNNTDSSIINSGGIVPASGGLVQLMNLDQLLSESIYPSLDVIDETIGVVNQQQQQQVQASGPSTGTTTTTTSPEEQRRRSQLRTMGNFISPAYLDQHIQTIRTKDVELFHHRSTEYAMAINNAIASANTTSAMPSGAVAVAGVYGSNPMTTEPSCMDRTPKPFRPSSSRSEMLLSGIPFNVHTATLALDVLDPSSTTNTTTKGAVFVNTTHGAPSDHARGFGNVFTLAGTGSSSSNNNSNSSNHTTGGSGNSNSTSLGISVPLNSPVGPAMGGLRRLEAKRIELATEVSNLQTVLIMSIGNYFMEQRQQQQQQNVQKAGQGQGPVPPLCHVPARNTEIRTLRWKVFEAVQCLHHLTWMCAVRRASVFSQALSIGVSTYLNSLTCDTTRLLSSTWPDVWVKHGYLICYEGLLSAVGKELGMMEDASTGIAMLRTVQMILVPDDGRVFPPPTIVKNTPGVEIVPVPFSSCLRWIALSKHGQTFVLQIGVIQSFYNERIPNALKNGTPVRFFPIMFEVGVDIRQWGANTGSNMIKRSMSTSAASTAGDDAIAQTNDSNDDDVDEDTVGVSDTDVLVQLNYEAFQKMNEYAFTVSPPQQQQQQPPLVPGQPLPPHPYLAPLYHHIGRSAGKMNHDILDLAATLAQQLGGGGAVFCKSGKDRTAMHVTYKQAQFINNFRNSINQSGQQQHQQQQQQQNTTATVTDATNVLDTTLADANLIRIYGTRLPICEKNVGQAKFAFNSLQVKFMPDALKPPSSTLAGFLKGGKVFGGGGIES